MSDRATALVELRDALEDAIRRAYCEPLVQPLPGEDPEIVAALAKQSILTNPRKMRQLAAIQQAAWDVVEARVAE